jgi:uncharacterized membrane protein (DUF2068 family)
MDTRNNLIAKHFGLRGVSLFEAGKGLIGLVVGAWLVSLRHKDLESVAAHLLSFLHKVLHLSPDGHIARSIMRGAGRVNHENLHLWALLAFAYAAIRFTEAVGLWKAKEWAEWFALISGAMYMPYEIFELARHPTLIKVAIVALNALIVWYLAWILRDSHRRKRRTEPVVEAQTEPAP